VPTGLTATRIVEATHGSTTFQGTGAAPGPTSGITQPFSDAGVPNAVRVIDSFTNNTNAAITGTVSYNNNLGSDSNTRYNTQGSGNRYLVSNQYGVPLSNGEGPTDPTVTSVFGNSGAASNPTLTFANGNTNETSSYTITVQPGQTVRLVTFGVVTGDVNRQGARTDANADGVPDEVVGDIARGRSIAESITNGGNPIPANSPFFSGISQADRATIANFRFAAPAADPAPAPCYVTGTRIRVLRAQSRCGYAVEEMPVERLCVGDLALTASGKPCPIRWIGSRSYPGLSTPQHDRPVRIRAGALAAGVPARDLLVSPDHALMVSGLFVAAGHLVNGTSIIRGEAVRDLTYWHVELDSHDLLLTENTPAESFLAAPGVRCGFDGVQALDAGAAPVPYASRTELGPELAALRGRLARRAISSGEAADLSPVRAWLDRCVVGSEGLLHVGGWAHDPAQPDAPVCLDVMVDGAVVAFTVASEYRGDLVAAGVGDGRVGFDLGLDVRLAPGVPHTVEVHRSADGALVCAKQVDAAGTWTALLAA
jgi:hypothetical protein